MTFSVLRAQRYKAVLLTFNDRGQALSWLYSPSPLWFKLPGAAITPLAQPDLPHSP